MEISLKKLSSEESGTAYRGNFKDGFGWEAFADVYWVPLKMSLIPGLYGQVKYSQADFRYNKR